MTANESLVCSLTIFYSGQTNGRNIHRRPSRASSGLLSFSFFFFLFLFHVSSRCCGPLCFHLLGNRHQHNSVEFECSIQPSLFFLWKSQKERRKKVKETKVSQYKLWSMGIRDIALVLFLSLSYSLRLFLLIVTSARIHNIYCIPFVSRAHLAIVDFNEWPTFHDPSLQIYTISIFIILKSGISGDYMLEMSEWNLNKIHFYVFQNFADFNRLVFISVLNQRNRWMDTTYQQKINRQTINNFCVKKTWKFILEKMKKKRTKHSP